MRYNQPYGVSDPNAPYINGNPTTGIMGSIPPAASIEYPQREIVRLIGEAGLVPANDDLEQLMKAIKRVDVHNVWKVANNVGNASQWSAAIASLAIVPPPAGTQVWFKPGYESVPGGTVFSVNGSAFAQVVHPDLAPVKLGDIVPTAWLLLFYDGTRWQILCGSSRILGVLPVLQKHISWYVNGGTGNDAVYDGTSPNVLSATVGPFATIQRACDETLQYTMNNYTQTIYVANGAYAGNILLRPLNGSGRVHLVGNPGAPANVHVNGGFYQNGGDYNYDGFRLTNASLDGFSNVFGQAYINNMEFGPCARFHISCSNSGAYTMLRDGLITIEAGADCVSHISASTGGFMTYPVSFPANWPNLNILGLVTINHFANCFYLASLQMRYGSIVGAANSFGNKFTVRLNAVLSSEGGGLSYYPGGGSYAIDTGGQYT